MLRRKAERRRAGASREAFDRAGEDAPAIIILGNAALEGDDAASARFTARSRKINYTQIFASTVEVSGSELAVRQVGVRDELDYQKVQRTRELLRDLENSVLNGRAPAATPEGSSTVRRTMRGIRSSITTNVFKPTLIKVAKGDTVKWLDGARVVDSSI